MRPLALALTTAVALLACGDTASTPAQSKQALTAPPGFVFEDVVTGLNQGIAFDFAPDNSIYIAEKPGLVRVFEAGRLLAAPFLDLRDEVLNFSDRGLESIALHPDFPDTPFVYVYFVFDPYSVGAVADPDSSTAPPTVVLVRRYTADAATGYRTALAGSGVTLVGASGPANLGTPVCQHGESYVQDCIPMDQNYHTGGMLKFGTDGMLFVSTGDGYENAPYPNKQRTVSPDSLAGKVLRVHPLTGDAPADNPHFDPESPRSNRSRVYNLGLRNPFRMTISPFDGEPVIGDVGWDSWEEINTGREANFGWPCYEGGNGTSIIQPGFQNLDLPNCVALYESPGSVTAPLYAYEHEGQGASVILGDFYTGSAYPAAYRNALFFTDFNRQWMKYLSFDAQGGTPTVHDFATDVGAIVQMSRGPDTNLYYVQIDNGTLRRIRFSDSGNTPPVAAFTLSPRAGLAPLLVNVSAAGSYDPDTDPLRYAWDFGDGTTAEGLNASHSYPANGNFTITLTVSDGSESTSTTRSVLVGNAPPVAAILTPEADASFRVDEVVSFRGAGSDAEDGALTGASLRWTGIMHHNDHAHYDAVSATGESGTFRYGDHEDNTHLELCLTVTDSIGLSDTACIDLFHRAVNCTFETDPSGLELVYNGQRRVTPFTVPVYVNSIRSIVAPEPQGQFVWSAWSDGGALVHDIVGAETDTTLRATYVRATIPSEGLVHHWPLDDDARDSVGDAHGTLVNGAALTSDPARGPVLGCDGLNDHVSLQNPLGTTFSLSAWVRTSQISPAGDFGYQGNGLIWSDVGGVANDFTLALLNDRLAVFDGAAPSGSEATNGQARLNDDRWHHLAVVRDEAGVLTLYVDGSVDARGAAASAAPNANPLLHFCGNVLDNRYVAGRLDDVRQYDRVLTSREVVMLAIPPDRMPSEPSHHWPLDRDARDRVGTNDGTLHGAPAFETDPERGEVLVCDGTNDRISMRNFLPGTFTLSAWLQTTQTSPTGTLGYEGNGLFWSDVGGPANDFTVALLNDRLAAYDGAAPEGSYGTNGSTPLNDGAWHHIAVVRNGATRVTTLYVDGVLDGTGVAGAAAPVANPTWHVCANVLDARFFAGRLDDVQQFDRALSGEEVAELVLPPTLPDAGAPDAGTPDASAPDAGTPDAGTPDAGTSEDASMPIDAGIAIDASSPRDAGAEPERDAGATPSTDSGITPPGDGSDGRDVSGDGAPAPDGEDGDGIADETRLSGGNGCSVERTRDARHAPGLLVLLAFGSVLWRRRHARKAA